MRPAVGLLLLVSLASRAGGQATDREPLDVWVALTLGAANIRHEPTGSDIGARLSLWGSVGHAVFGVRTAAAAPFLADTYTEVHDFAVLGGFRAASPADESFGGAAASFTIGPSVMSSSSYVGGRVDRRTGPEPALAFDVDGTLHARFVGLGASLFGAIGPHNMYSGVGLTLSLGKIR